MYKMNFMDSNQWARDAGTLTGEWLENAKALAVKLLSIGFEVCDKSSAAGVLAAGVFLITASIIYALCMPVMAVRKLLGICGRPQNAA